MKVQTIEDEIFTVSMELAEKSTRLEFLAGSPMYVNNPIRREKLMDCSLELKSVSRKLSISVIAENKSDLLRFVYDTIARAIEAESSESVKAVLRSLHLQIAQEVEDRLGAVVVAEPTLPSNQSDISEEWKELLGNDRIWKMALEVVRAMKEGRSGSDVITDVLGMLPRVVKLSP